MDKGQEMDHTAITYLNNREQRLKTFGNRELTEHDFVNACFRAAEQVNEVQANWLDVTMEAATDEATQSLKG